ncbi:MAG: hypothetical protein N5P05_001725 [Chroococcopsis gigantea SAG 12.99]|jgi:hypothetical protein|nr:hypothetical protein [Chlorogloea purpurea SAG 13.99]MDV3000119.1 hypothetical protein [Chroococcopsis gigantea SAG 12.99]
MSFVSNFAFLKAVNERLADLGVEAESYLHSAPKITLIVLGQFAQSLSVIIGREAGITVDACEKQSLLIDRLKHRGLITPRITLLLHNIRKERNKAYYRYCDDYQIALGQLQSAYELGIWYCQAFTSIDCGDLNSFIIPPSGYRTISLELQVADVMEAVPKKLAQLPFLEEKIASVKQNLLALNQSHLARVQKLEKYLEDNYENHKAEHDREKINLVAKKNSLELAVIRLELEIDKLTPFRINNFILAEIIQLQERQKQIEKEIASIGVNLEISKELYGNYARERENRMKKLLAAHEKSKRELSDELKRHFLQLNSQKQEIESLLKKYIFLSKTAETYNIYIQSLSYEILRAIEFHNIPFQVKSQR